MNSMDLYIKMHFEWIGTSPNSKSTPESSDALDIELLDKIVIPR